MGVLERVEGSIDRLGIEGIPEDSQGRGDQILFESSVSEDVPWGLD